MSGRNRIMMNLLLPPLCLLLAAAPPPRFEGDPEAEACLGEALRAALRATEAFGPLPGRPWTLCLHTEAAAFEAATGAPPGRAAAWVGDRLHLRPVLQLRRRDLGTLLRHELVHRRLAGRGLRRWDEEARCLWAEGRTAPLPPRLPPAPGLQARLDRALAGGSTREQAWAYRALRAWIAGAPLPGPPPPRTREEETWRREALRAEERLTVRWPAARLPRHLEVNGAVLARDGREHTFAGPVRFGPGTPVTALPGPVVLRSVPGGWSLVWRPTEREWRAAAAEGELGPGSPREALRALAALLGAWRAAHALRHPDGSLCPLTHCAVLKGGPSPEALAAAADPPRLALAGERAVFCASTGGRALSPREVWGRGPEDARALPAVPGDPWASWTRVLTPGQVAFLKRTVPPGLRPGQRGLRLGASGPYAVEALRLAAGRAFGWTAWPGNACEGTLAPDGALHLEGRGWGHNAGLDLALALHRARQGWRAEAILAEAFGPEALP